MRFYQDTQTASASAATPTTATLTNGTPIGVLMDGTEAARVTVRAPEGQLLESFTALPWIWHPALEVWSLFDTKTVTVPALSDSRAHSAEITYKVSNGSRLYVTVNATTSGTAGAPEEQDRLTVRTECEDSKVNP
jgi:hypothetical protein